LSLPRLVRDLPLLLRSPPDAFVEWQRRYGEVVRVPLSRPPMFQIYSPEDIRHVLMERGAIYRKTGGVRSAERLFGRGLLRSQGSLYRRQRAIIEPSFHRTHLVGMVGAMAREAAAAEAEWRDGEADLARAMGVLTLRILGRCLFGADLSGPAPGLLDDLLLCLRFIHPTTPLVLPRWIPTPGRIAYERAVARIEQVAYGLIEERRRAIGPGGDLLAALLEARTADGRPLDDRQLRDEVMTMLLAGHGTTATGLSWFWHEVGRRPALFARLRAEVDQVLGPRRLPEPADLRRLELVEATFRETLRLHPPVWAIGRRAVEDDVLPSGTRVPAGASISVLPYVVHRRPDLFPEPLKFRPERFLRATRQPLRAGSYIPFGAGERSCIGEGVAVQEATIIVAMVVRGWDVEPVAGRAVVPESLLVRRPRHGVWARLRRRR
jgi:cytochrome P450